MDTNITPNTAAALWDVAADGWARYGPTIERIEADLSALICAALPPLAGLDVLELGSGSGEFARLLAADIGPDGHLLATDIAPAMTRVQTARLADLTNTSVRGGVDVTDLPLADDSADVVVFRMGLMMSPQPDRALQSIRCVLRPGGRFVTTVWGPLTENPWLTSVGMAAMTQGLVAGGPPVGPGEPFSLPDPDILRDCSPPRGSPLCRSRPTAGCVTTGMTPSTSTWSSPWLRPWQLRAEDSPRSRIRHCAQRSPH